MSADYDVGYGKPPKETQFKSGESGNPKGRPKGSKNLSTVMQETLSQRVVITEGNKQVTVTMLEAMVKGLFTNSIKGKAGATSTSFKLIQQMEESNKGVSIPYHQDDGSVKHHEVDIGKVLDGLGVSK
tara:strand:- start:2567 stop:2950 length:384 start_codon:yes stop_codon:yes gene_type:complete